MRRRRTYVSVSVDVDLAEIDTEDMKVELESRGETIVGDVSLDAIYYALKFGQEEQALQLTKKYVCDQLGRTL